MHNLSTSDINCPVSIHSPTAGKHHQVSRTKIMRHFSLAVRLYPNTGDSCTSSMRPRGFHDQRQVLSYLAIANRTDLEATGIANTFLPTWLSRLTRVRSFSRSTWQNRWRRWPLSSLCYKLRRCCKATNRLKIASCCCYTVCYTGSARTRTQLCVQCTLVFWLWHTSTVSPGRSTATLSQLGKERELHRPGLVINWRVAAHTLCWSFIATRYGLAISEALSPKTFFKRSSARMFRSENAVRWGFPRARGRSRLRDRRDQYCRASSWFVVLVPSTLQHIFSENALRLHRFGSKSCTRWCSSKNWSQIWVLGSWKQKATNAKDFESASFSSDHNQTSRNRWEESPANLSTSGNHSFRPAARGMLWLWKKKRPLKIAFQQSSGLTQFKAEKLENDVLTWRKAWKRS